MSQCLFERRESGFLSSGIISFCCSHVFLAGVAKVLSVTSKEYKRVLPSWHDLEAGETVLVLTKS